MRIRAAASALVSLYLAQLEARHFSSETVALSRQALQRLLSHLTEQRVRDLRAVRIDHLVAFALALAKQRSKAGRPLSGHTRAAYLSRVRTFFAFLEARGIVLTNPARDLEVRAAQRLPRCLLSPRMAERLMTAPDASTPAGIRDRAFLELLYGSGIRAGECVRLDLQDVDLKEQTLLVRSGKGHKDRLVPIPGQATRALELYLSTSRPDLARESETALFVSRTGTRLSAWSLRIFVRRHAREARLDVRVSPHGLRHACATHLLRGGADVRHVQELLGHRRIETTALYTRVEVGDLKTMLRRSHPRERPRRSPRQR